jgi:hypothetical protein
VSRTFTRSLQFNRAMAAVAMATALLAMLLAALPVHGQEQFFTQSGGRGLQNAKTNARLGKVEGDVDTLNTEMAKVKPHAKADLGSCSDSKEKLRYDGNNWICEEETDPTVQEFAKKALPTCTGGSILGVSGGQFGCQPAGFLSNETDPTVQAFAKSPLPSCSFEQVLTVNNGNLSCVTDTKGVSNEKDPHVHDFARSDVNPTVPNCGASETLTMTGGHLSCKVDDKGITVETDPFVASFARTDVPGYTLAACATGELLNAVTVSGNVQLACQAGGAALSEVIALNDLSDVDTAGVTSGTVLMYTGTDWRAQSERDPTVPAWAKNTLATCAAGEVLSSDGVTLTCVADAGGSASKLNLADLGDVNVVSGSLAGKFLKYDGATSKWVAGTVQTFAQNTLPTCGTGEVLSGDGTNLTCTNDAGGTNDPVDLVGLGDVRPNSSSVLAPNDNDFLRWDSATSKWQAVHDKLSDVLTSGKWCYYDGTNVVCDRGAPLECSTGEVLTWNDTSKAFACVAGGTALGLGTMAVQNANDVSITGGIINGTVIGGSVPAAGTFTNLRATAATVSSLLVQGDGHFTGTVQVDGSLNVSGTQTIGGVSFANGGISATNISATLFSGDGSGLTNISANGLVAAGGTGSVQFKGVSGGISGTSSLVWDEAAKNLNVNGTVQVAGSGAEACTLSDSGKMRVVDVGGGDYRMQFCRP